MSTHRDEGGDMNPDKDYDARLLVVDDEPNIRDLLDTSLRFSGFEVFTSSTGNEAIREATENQPDLVVLDVMLPDMDGFTVTRRLRSEEHTSELQSRGHLVCRLLLEKKNS